MPRDQLLQLFRGRIEPDGFLILMSNERIEQAPLEWKVQTQASYLIEGGKRWLTAMSFHDAS